MSDTIKRFGERIRQLRSDLNLTQEEVGTRCGVKKAYISSIEKGNINPTLETIEKLAKALETKIFSLLEPSPDFFKDESSGKPSDKEKKGTDEFAVRESKAQRITGQHKRKAENDEKSELETMHFLSSEIAVQIITELKAGVLKDIVQLKVELEKIKSSLFWQAYEKAEPSRRDRAIQLLNHDPEKTLREHGLDQPESHSKSMPKRPSKGR